MYHLFPEPFTSPNVTVRASSNRQLVDFGDLAVQHLDRGGNTGESV